MMSLKKRWLRWILRGCGILTLVVLLANFWVIRSTQKQISLSVEELSVQPDSVAVVLGAGKTLVTGGRNLYFTRRMDTAAELYRSGKVRRFILSGDNSRETYSEPADMRDALIARGVAESALTLDFAGLRTLDTVVRAKQIFGVNHAVIITDDFHLPRAVFLANHFGLPSVGLQTKPLSWSTSAKTRVREYLARVKLLLDLYVLRTEPKFLGEKIALPPT